MELLFTHLRVTVDPSAAVTLAAVLNDDRFINKKTVCILTGGNIDLSSYLDILKQRIAENKPNRNE